MKLSKKTKIVIGAAVLVGVGGMLLPKNECHIQIVVDLILQLSSTNLFL